LKSFYKGGIVRNLSLVI